MRSEQEIQETIKHYKDKINEIAMAFERDNPQEVYWYIKDSNTCKLIIGILEWVLQEDNQ